MFPVMNPVQGAYGLKKAPTFRTKCATPLRRSDTLEIPSMVTLLPSTNKQPSLDSCTARGSLGTRYLHIYSPFTASGWAASSTRRGSPRSETSSLALSRLGRGLRCFCFFFCFTTNSLVAAVLNMLIALMRPCAEWYKSKSRLVSANSATTGALSKSFSRAS